MSETKRLGPWGWFVRAFAAGFGATFGMIVASVIACAVCYALVAAGVLAFASLGGIELDTANTPTTLTPEPTTGVAPPDLTTVQPYPHVWYPYAASDPRAADEAQPYPRTYGYSATGEADDGTSAADAQPAPPGIAVPSQPTTSPENDSSTALE